MVIHSRLLFVVKCHAISPVTRPDRRQGGLTAKMGWSSATAFARMVISHFFI